VEHARQHEQTEKVGSPASHLLNHFFVILDAHQRIQLRISPPEVHQQLSTVALERAQINVRRI
jgi:hypothetical protein